MAESIKFGDSITVTGKSNISVEDVKKQQLRQIHNLVKSSINEDAYKFDENDVVWNIKVSWELAVPQNALK